MDKAGVIQGYNNRRRRWDAVSSFAEVEALYNSIMPIKGKNNKLEYDIRPIGKRGDSHRRIAKVDDNTYYMTLDYIVFHMDIAKVCNVSPERIYQYCADTAPIMWTRKDGEEFLRIRNGSGDFAHTTIYDFIYTYCPKGMALHIENGRQYVVTSDEVYPLPKSAPTMRYDYAAKTLEFPDVDYKYLTFKVLGDSKFERVGEKIDVVTPHVNRDEKKQYAKALDEFFEWVVYMRPFIKEDGANYLQYGKVVESVERLTGDKVQYHRELTNQSFWSDKHELARGVLLDPDHLNRLDLAMVFYFDTWHVRLDTPEDMKRMRNRFNKLANTVFGFYKVEAV